MLDVRLADGRRLRGERLRWVINRLLTVPATCLAAARQDERSYVEQEWRALLCSALAAVPAPVFERPHPYALAGRWRSPAEWLVLAARAGLSTMAWRWDEEFPQGTPGPTGPESASLSGAHASCHALVVNGRTVPIPGVSEQTARACERLAVLSGSSLLHISLLERGDTVAFCGVATPADPRVGGEGALDVLVELLE